MDQLEKASPAPLGSPLRGSLTKAIVGAVSATLIVASITFAAGVGSSAPTLNAADAEEPTPTSTDSTATPIDLALHLEDGFVRVDWSVCDTNGFRFYAIVRSTDEQPTWPVGEGDNLVAVVEDIDETSLHDTDLPPGTVLSYRVFALADPIADLVVVCESPVRSVPIPGTAPTPTPAATPEPTPAATPEPTPEPTPAATPAPTPTPKVEPTPTPKVEPTPKPDPTIGLNVSLKERKPYVDWSRCTGRFDWYKVVRSTDAKVTWPMGEGDTLAAYVRKGGRTAFWDGNAPFGKKVWYRVFCVRATAGGYAVVASSTTKWIEIPGRKHESPPDPAPIAFEVTLTDGGVKLHWDARGGESFVAYKVVRSAGPNPSYLPGTDGTQVIAVITNPATTSFTDSHVEAGQTWYYRVQSIGYKNGQKVLLGQTPAIAVTVE